MGLLSKAKQLNNGYFLLSYTLMGKPACKPSKAVEALFGADNEDVQSGDGHEAFMRPDKTRFTTSARVKLGVISTNEYIYAQKAKLSYRDFTAKIGHSSKTTAANLEELKDVLELTEKSTYHIKVDYEKKPFILCYDFLFTEELQLEEGKSPVKLTDLEAILVCLIVNNKLNPNCSKEFTGAIKSVAGALNVPKSTVAAAINRLIDKGVISHYYRWYIDEKGNEVTIEGQKAKSKKEKTILTVHNRIIRRCNVIFKEYKKRVKEKKQRSERDVSRRKNGKQAAQPPKELTDQEKFDEIEAKFVKDKKYLNLSEKIKDLKNKSVDAFKHGNNEEGDALEATAKETFKELCRYLYNNGISRDKIPRTFASLILNIQA